MGTAATWAVPYGCAEPSLEERMAELTGVTVHKQSRRHSRRRKYGRPRRAGHPKGGVDPLGDVSTRMVHNREGGAADSDGEGVDSGRTLRRRAHLVYGAFRMGWQRRLRRQRRCRARGR